MQEIKKILFFLSCFLERMIFSIKEKLDIITLIMIIFKIYKFITSDDIIHKLSILFDIYYLIKNKKR